MKREYYYWVLISSMGEHTIKLLMPSLDIIDIGSFVTIDTLTGYIKPLSMNDRVHGVVIGEGRRPRKKKSKGLPIWMEE